MIADILFVKLTTADYQLEPLRQMIETILEQTVYIIISRAYSMGDSEVRKNTIPITLRKVD